MAGKFRFIAVAMAFGLWAIGAHAASVTENFDTNSDSRWEHSNNKTAPENYGWQNTNTAGGAAGELGGTITRSAAVHSYYAFNIGNFNPATTALTASGKYHLETHGGSSGILLGFFNGANSLPNVANHDGNPKNFLGSYIIDGNDPWGYLWDPGGFQDRAEIPGGSLAEPGTYDFTMTWDPTLGSKGRLTFGITGFGTGSVDYSGDPIGSNITHFGIMNPDVSGGNDVFAFDNLTFTSANPIPEPASLALVSIGGLALLRRRRSRA